MLKVIHIIIVSVVLLSQVDPVSGQNRLDNTEPEHYFDFWLGEWELTWQNEDGTTATGSNTIERILDGHIIREKFKAMTGDMAGFTGESYSAYNAGTGEWKQTWVDNQGAYLDFTGEISGDKRIFKRNALSPEGDEFLQRMVFYNISEQSLTWDWETSQDDGQTWQLRWRIHYQRVDIQ
ncbi:MAG: DUF1579 family protein [Balneolaceae bacterium]